MSQASELSGLPELPELPGAVLFDLDDTLFDHDHCSRAALWSVRAEHPALSGAPWEELRESYSRLLEEIHVRLLSGELTLQEARRERFRRLFSELGEEVSEDAVRRAVESYAAAYRGAWAPVAGAEELLVAVGERAKVAVVTNNLLAEQRDKLAALGLAGHVDELVASEEIGVAKPEPGIFRVALARLGCSADEAVMVGDSWESDVAGARAAGIRAVWLNRRGRPCPDPELASELESLESLEAAFALLSGRKRAV